MRGPGPRRSCRAASRGVGAGGRQGLAACSPRAFAAPRGYCYERLRPVPAAAPAALATAVQAEHSLELHTPFIVYTMASQPFKLVPIMVGSLSTDGCARGGSSSRVCVRACVRVCGSVSR